MGRDDKEILPPLAAPAPPLMAHQEDGVVFLEAAVGRAMLADEMGLGKTRTTIEYLRRNGLKATVVTTKSFLYGWKAEVKRWWPEAYVTMIAKVSELSPVIGYGDVTVTTYDVLWRMEEPWKLPGGVVVFDESHKVMNRTAKRSLAARKLAASKKQCICLTGTPQPNGEPRQLWHQLLLVFPRFMTWTKFAVRYCDPKQVWAGWAGRYVWDYSGSSNVEELRALMAPRFLRRTKSLLCLPELTSSDVIVPLSEARTKRKGDEQWAVYAHRLAFEKKDATVALADDVVERGSKVLVFTGYVAVRDHVRLTFGDKAVTVTADMSAEERSEAVRRFQEDPSVRVLTATTQICAEALTLTAADTVVFNDRPWSPGLLDQAQSRAHRKGQERPVHVYYVATDTAFDRLVKETLERRQHVTEKLLDEKIGGKR